MTDTCAMSWVEIKQVPTFYIHIYGTRATSFLTWEEELDFRLACYQQWLEKMEVKR